MGEAPEQNQMDNPVRNSRETCTQLKNATPGCEIGILTGSWSDSERENLVRTKEVTTESQPYKKSSK